MGLCVCLYVKVSDQTKWKEKMKDFPFFFRLFLLFLWFSCKNSIGVIWLMLIPSFTSANEEKNNKNSCWQRLFSQCVGIFVALFMLMWNMCSAYDFLSIRFPISLYTYFSLPASLSHHCYHVGLSFCAFLWVQRYTEKNKKKINVKAFTIELSSNLMIIRYYVNQEWFSFTLSFTMRSSNQSKKEKKFNFINICICFVFLLWIFVISFVSFDSFYFVI